MIKHNLEPKEMQNTIQLIKTNHTMRGYNSWMQEIESLLFELPKVCGDGLSVVSQSQSQSQSFGASPARSWQCGEGSVY